MMGNQERRSILCPRCKRLISIDESPCPHCGLRHPGSRWRNNFWTRVFHNGDQLIRSIIYLTCCHVHLVDSLESDLHPVFHEPFCFSLSRRSKPAPSGSNGNHPHRQIPSLVDAPFRKLPACRHSSHPVQHGGVLSNCPAHCSRIRGIPNGLHLHPQRCGRLCGFLLCRYSFHLGRLGSGLRPYRRSALLRQEPRGILRAACLSAGRRLGPRDLPLWFPFSRVSTTGLMPGA